MSTLDEHLEPLTGTSLRGKGKAETFHRPAEHTAAIAVFQNVYHVPSCQQNIYELAKLLLDSQGFQYVFVEGARGPLDATYARQFGATIEERIAVAAPVSPGILQLLDEWRPEGNVFGVDDIELCTEHHAVQRQCTTAAEPWRQLVSHFREALVEAKQATQYTESMLWLSQCLFRENDGLTLGEKIIALWPVATTVGLEDAFFPMLTKFRQALTLEKALNFAQIEKERTAFVRQLVDTLGGWWKRSETHAVLEPSRALPPIRFWLTKTKQSEADLEREVATHGISAILQRCQQWLYDFLVGGALKYRDGVISHTEYYNDLLSLGLGLKVDMFRFVELMRYLSYITEASTISGRQMLGEFQGYMEALRERLSPTPEQDEVHELEKSFFLLSKAGAMTLTSDEVDFLDEEMTWPVLQERLGPYSARARHIRLPRQLETTTGAAFRFCEISAQRSRIMTEEAVRQLFASGGTGAILVCGGHHTAAITKLLTQYKTIAWSVITPSMNSEEVLRGTPHHD